ncbi:hypothetical protein ACE14D_06425 [Streptomyces sp. Act-28]
MPCAVLRRGGFARHRDQADGRSLRSVLHSRYQFLRGFLVRAGGDEHGAQQDRAGGGVDRWDAVAGPGVDRHLAARFVGTADQVAQRPVRDARQVRFVADGLSRPVRPGADGDRVGYFDRRTGAITRWMGDAIGLTGGLFLVFQRGSVRTRGWTHRLNAGEEER